MTTAFVLMTAMPPTKGHINLIRFASNLAPKTVVIVCTQPDEPFTDERYAAVAVSTREMHNVVVKRLHQRLLQDPAADGFWPMWDNIMHSYGFKEGDLCVTSELYGATLAERLGGHFMPYDPKRELYYTKGTNVRDHMTRYFPDIAHNFQRHLRTTVTVFGAESTGKTTLSSKLADDLHGHWLFEYARPYLETVGPEITVPKMKDIWQGQAAIQRSAKHMFDKPFVVQDTDLFSTVGYWNQPHWRKELGDCPTNLWQEAVSLKSDLYLITQSNIPFEQDEIRYGDGVRESPDEYWIDLAKKYGLNYVVLESDNRAERLTEAVFHARVESDKKAMALEYDRGGF